MSKNINQKEVHGVKILYKFYHKFLTKRYKLGKIYFHKKNNFKIS